uniref:Uncharacterized protein n=1 Tax=Anguilla anguilla TaxID=7936 RepID=A0A0E9RPA4_ANGAN
MSQASLDITEYWFKKRIK